MTHIALQKDTAEKGPGMTGRPDGRSGSVGNGNRGRAGRGGELLWQHFLCLFDREAPSLPFAVRPRHTGNATQSDA